MPTRNVQGISLFMHVLKRKTTQINGTTYYLQYFFNNYIIGLGPIFMGKKGLHHQKDITTQINGATYYLQYFFNNYIIELGPIFMGKKGLHHQKDVT